MKEGPRFWPLLANHVGPERTTKGAAQARQDEGQGINVRQSRDEGSADSVRPCAPGRKLGCSSSLCPEALARNLTYTIDPETENSLIF